MMLMLQLLLAVLTRAADRLPTFPRRQLVRANDAGGTGRLVMAAPDQPVTASTSERTIRGMVVPYGPSGLTSAGALTFSKGSLTWKDPKRVKLLREHDQRDVLGYATQLDDQDDGLWATFHVPEGENGDRALVEAANGLRDAFSVGVQLDDASLKRLRRSQGAAIAGAGHLREVSQVSVPAFDDARAVDDAAAAAGADLVVASWAPPGSTTTTTPDPDATAGAGTTTGGTMPPTTAAGDTASDTTAAAAVTTGTGDQGDAQAAGTTTGPTTVPAVAGAAVVTATPSTYTFGADSEGHSIIADLYAGTMNRDSEAAERVERFNAELAGGNPASQHAFVTAAATRDNVDGAGTDLPPAFGGGTQWRPDLMRQLVDVKRPFISRLDRVPINNAQPFAIPVVGEFTGVGDHTEGTPHRPAGTFTLGGGDVVQPKATSGAWEASRELIDAGNPVLDRIAARAMLRDYQRQSEGKVHALLTAYALTEGSTVYGVNSTLAMRGALIDFVNDDEEGADIAAVSKGMFKALGLDVDDVNRPQLPFVNPSNAVGTMKAGHTGLSIDGVDLFRSARLDTSLAAAGAGGDAGVLARSEGILWAESNVLQFRFDEVLGPGVVKLALWAYSGAAIMDTDDVLLVRSGADPTP